MKYLALALAIACISTEARAQLYTEDGVEIGVDSRLFALFAMWNGLGFDADDRTGPAPLHKPQLAPARAKVRQNLGRPGAAMKDMEAVLQKNQKPARDYVAAALELGPAPNFESKGTSPLAQAIAGPLRDWFTEEGGAQLLRIVTEEAKPTQKRLLPILDKSIKSTTKLVRLGDTQEQLLDDSGAAGRVVVVINDLDRHGVVQRVQQGDVTYVVTGPIDAGADDERVVAATTAAYARTLVVREAAKVGPGTIAEVRGKLADDAKAAVADDKAMAAELLACAFMKKVRGAAAPCVESPLAGQPAAEEALTAMAPRVDAYAGTTAVLSVAMADLLAPLPPPAPAPDAVPPPVDDKGKGKKGKGKG